MTDDDRFSWRCFFSLHGGTWSTPTTGVFSLGRGAEIVTKEVALLYQFKICPRCGKYEWRFV